ncbi:tetratricopeptide repeat protein [Maribellus sp. YY47]|uniref:tetratricopeptide repeat protein n=1 Tax=Maribellus sp. YY47 TaxID=2929486 RepID=UPI0020017C5C|nr:tetratricopeptide repeat protein [Maribellus sp. YY47]MCK3684122.1 tetratricopeptide repeat protein [Maribellus sp. YY47]
MSDKNTRLNSIVTFILFVSIIISFQSCQDKTQNISFFYPFEGTLYPKDIAPPNFVWNETTPEVSNWLVTLKLGENIIVDKVSVEEPRWKPSKETWSNVCNVYNQDYTLTVQGINKSTVSEGKVTFAISQDAVEAPIFFRSVPLPFKFAKENMKNLLWHLGSISTEEKPHRILGNIPVCANCHSFSDDGKYIGMDVDAANDKGSYVITEFEKETKFTNDNIIDWDESQNGAFTYGLLSKMSPDGRYSISTLHDCEIFIEQNDLEFSQLFFPFKGILMTYDRFNETFTPLPGAADTNLVQSNPAWTPDGQNILFARAKAKHYEESGIQNGSRAKLKDMERYKKFEQSYVSRDSLFKYDIYTIPFNEGRGGIATPLKGASGNGMSNYFPRISPDGKWIVYNQAESFMLLQKDSKLWIVPAEGGEARMLTCNQDVMNSWHSWSPNSKWLVFSTKKFGAYTQLFLTHIDENGNDSPPVYLDNFSFDKYANNIPEFVNMKYDPELVINPLFLAEDEFLIREGEILQEKGMNNEAYKSFSEAIAKFPKSADAYYKRGYTALQLDQYKLAIDDLDKAISLEKIADYFYVRGRARMKMNDERAAISDFNEAIKLDPTDYKAYGKLGVIYINQTKDELALQNLEKAVTLNISDYLSHFNRGIILYKQKRYEEAKQSFSSSAEYCTNQSRLPAIYENRGRCYMDLGDYYQAIADLKKVISAAPRQISVYILLSKAQLAVGNKAEAISLLQQASHMGSKQAVEMLKTIKQ